MNTVSERMEAGVYEHKIPYSKETIKEYRDEENLIVDLFKEDLFKEFEVEDNPKKEQAFRLAWRYGHSNGFMEVYNYFDELVDLIK